MSSTGTALGVALALVLAATLANCASIEKPSDNPNTEHRLQAIADDAWAALGARYPDATRPDTTSIRIVSPDDWAGAITGCMNDGGFPEVAARHDGGVDAGAVNAEQQEAYDLTYFACTAQYPVDPKYSEPLTDAQVERLYRYYKDDLAPCLEDQGFTISAAPSEQLFFETYESEPWIPYGEIIMLVSPEQLQNLQKSCPEEPADLWD